MGVSKYVLLEQCRDAGIQYVAQIVHMVSWLLLFLIRKQVGGRLAVASDRGKSMDTSSHKRGCREAKKRPGSTASNIKKKSWDEWASVALKYGFINEIDSSISGFIFRGIHCQIFSRPFASSKS